MTKRFVAKRPNPATRSGSELRQEIDTSIRFITQAINKDPKKAAKIFEGWMDTSAKSDKKKRAA
jgi:hypothetical protein